MNYPPLTDQEAMATARALHLTHPEVVLRHGLLRRVVELAHWGRLRARDAEMQRYLSKPDFKRIAAGDALDD